MSKILPLEIDAYKWYLENRDIKTVFDVGAASDTIFHDLDPSLDVHYFEPDSKRFRKLSSKVGKLNITGNAYLNKVGLSSKECYKDLYVSLGSVHKRVPKKIPNIQYDYEIIKLITLDEYCKEKGIDSIDFLKIDVEGHEFEVLQGAINMLPNIKVIEFEYGATYEAAGITLQDVFDILKGRSICKLYKKNGDTILQTVNNPTPKDRFAIFLSEI